MSARGLKRTVTYEPAISNKRGRTSKSKTYRKNTLRGTAFVNGRLSTSGTGPEVKNYDYQLAATNVSSGVPYIADIMSGIAQGDTETTRTGQKICVKGLAIVLNMYAVVGGSVTYNSGGTVTMAPIDVFVIHDGQPDGSTPTVGTILGFTNSVCTYGLPANLDRFKVLRREHFNFDISSGLTSIVDMFIPLDVSVRYPDATGSPNTNSFYVVAVSSAGAVAAGTTSPYINGLVRIKFTDS